MFFAIITAIFEAILDVSRFAAGSLSDSFLSFVCFLAGATSYSGYISVAIFWFFTLFLLFMSIRYLASSPSQPPSIRSVILSVGSWIWSLLAPVVFFLLSLVVRRYYLALNRLNGWLGIFVDDWNAQPRLRGQVRAEFEALTRRQKTLRDEICDLNRRITGCLYRYNRIAAKLQGIGELARRDCVKLSVRSSAKSRVFAEVRPSDLVGNSVQFLNLPGPWVRLIFRIDYVVWNLQASLSELRPFVRENEDKVTKLREELEKLTQREAAEDEILRLAEREYTDARTRIAKAQRQDGLTQFKRALKKDIESDKPESWWHKAQSRVHRGSGSPPQQRQRRGGLARPRVPPVALPTQEPLLPAQESQPAVQEGQDLAETQEAVELHQEPPKRSTVHFDDQPKVVVYEPLQEVSSMMLPVTEVKQPEAIVSDPTPTTPTQESYLSRFVVPFEDFSRFLARQEEANWVQEMKNCFKLPEDPILRLPLQVEMSDEMDFQRQDDQISAEQPIREEEHAEPSLDLMLVDYPTEQYDPMDVDEQTTTDPVVEQPSTPVQPVQSQQSLMQVTQPALRGQPLIQRRVTPTSGPTDTWQAARPVMQTIGQATPNWEGELAIYEADLMDIDRDQEFEKQLAEFENELDQEVAPATAELPAIGHPNDVSSILVLNQASDRAPSGQDATPRRDRGGVGQSSMQSDGRPNESMERQVTTQPESVTTLAGLMQTAQLNEPALGRQPPQQALEHPPRMTAPVLTQPSLPLPPTSPVPGQLVITWPNSDPALAQLDAPQQTTSTPSTPAHAAESRPRKPIPTPDQILMPPPPKPTTPRSRQTNSCLRPNTRRRRGPVNQKPPTTTATPSSSSSSSSSSNPPATPNPVEPTPKAAEASKPTVPARPTAQATPKPAEEAKPTDAAMEGTEIFALPIPEQDYPTQHKRASFVRYTGAQVVSELVDRLIPRAEAYLTRRVDEEIVDAWMAKLEKSIRAELVEGGKPLTHAQACNYIDHWLTKSARDPTLVYSDRNKPINQRMFVNAIREELAFTEMGVCVDSLSIGENDGMLDP